MNNDNVNFLIEEKMQDTNTNTNYDINFLIEEKMKDMLDTSLFEQEEVRDLLRGVSAELARLQERERFLESELRAMQTRGLSAPGALDEEMVTALLGEETARVLTSARE